MTQKILFYFIILFSCSLFLTLQKVKGKFFVYVKNEFCDYITLYNVVDAK